MSFTDNINGIPAQDAVLRQGIATLRNTVISNTIKPLTVDHNGVYTSDTNNGTYGYSPVTVDTGVYTGATAPDNNLGKVGDYYYQISKTRYGIKSVNNNYLTVSPMRILANEFYVTGPFKLTGIRINLSEAVTVKYYVLDNTKTVIYESDSIQGAVGWNEHTLATPISLVYNQHYIIAANVQDKGTYTQNGYTIWNTEYVIFVRDLYSTSDNIGGLVDDSVTCMVDPVLETDNDHVIAEYIKDNDAWVSISGSPKMILSTLNATDNGTYNAPTGTAYSSVSVDVGPEIISRSDWNALTTAQKQSKGLVAIQDSSTGFKRGEFVNGADYIEANKYIPYSNNDSVLCEAYADNFDGASDTWGVGTSPLQYVDNTHKPSLDTTENAVYIQTKTNGVVPYVDVGNSQKNYTIYFIARIPSPTGQYERLTSCAYGYDSGNSSVICRSNNSDVLMFSTWANDTNTSHDIKDYCVACLKLINDNGSKTTKMYLYDGTEVTSLTKVLNNIARYICIGKFDISSSSSNQYPSDSYFKYFAAVDGAETDTVIENNIMNLYNEFLTE